MSVELQSLSFRKPITLGCASIPFGQEAAAVDTTLAQVPGHIDFTKEDSCTFNIIRHVRVSYIARPCVGPGANLGENSNKKHQKTIGVCLESKLGPSLRSLEKYTFRIISVDAAMHKGSLTSL